MDFSSVEDSIESKDVIECYEWIKRCVDMENIPFQSINELAILLLRELSDGVLLLNILSVLSNKEIDPKKYREYTSRPNDSQFECLKNLRLFNNLVVNHFKISEDELIDAVDIVNGRKLGKFISLLSKISHSEYAKARNIRGFPEECHNINPNVEFYNKIEEIMVSTDIYSNKRVNMLNNEHQPDEEKIYETLVQHKPDVPAASKSKRDMCVSEIVESEKNYVESLDVLVQGYKKPLLSILQKDEIEVIFSLIEELYQIHQMLLSKLTIACIPNQSKLHDVFIESQQELLIYGKYCANLQLAQNIVHDMVKTNSIKRSHLDKCQLKSGKFKKFPLSDLLTLPMQRILRYHLLLQTLLKYTDNEHQDHIGLKKAHESMCFVASYVNDVKRDQEAIISIDKIQGEMTGIHLPQNKKLSDYGRRHKDGELKLMLENEQKPKQRHVFIFDKMILLAKRKGVSYDFKHAFYLPDKCPEVTDVLSKKQEKGFPFKLNVRNDKNMVPILMFTKSEEMRNQWIEAIKIAIDNQYPEGYKSHGFFFDMTTFKDNETCNVCNKLLSGIFYQGYRCRKTSVVAHKKCISLISSIFPLVESNSEILVDICLNPDQQNNSDANNQIEIVSNNKSSANEIFLNQGLFQTDKINNHDFNNKNIRNNVLPNSSYRDAFGMSPFTSSQSLSSNDILSNDGNFHETWYVGKLERKDATDLLKNQLPGTFLIRISKSQLRNGELSLSVMDSEPKHMKIHKEDYNESSSRFYIEESNKFFDLKSLVEFYSNNCLNDYFKLDKPNLKLAMPINLVSSIPVLRF